MKRSMLLKTTSLSLLLAGGLAAAPLYVSAGDMDSDGKAKAMQESGQNDSMEEELKEAWMEGKLETALMLNRHLNNFTIDSEFDRGSVLLTGTVRSDVDRDLAEQIALDVDGVKEVDNQLRVVNDEPDRDNTDTFSSRVEDSTLTAEVKIKLLANGNTEGLDINVDTSQRVVTLKGNVASAEKKQLAEKIAANVDGVREVNNELSVVGS